MSTSSVSVKVLTWEGTLSIERAAELKNELMNAFEASSQVVVSLSLVENLDLSIIQLLASASLEALRTGKSFHLTGTIHPEVAQVFLVSGFLERSTDNARNLEIEFLKRVAGKGAVEK